MKNLTFFFCLLTLGLFSQSGEPLELIDIKQLSCAKKFELSGLAYSHKHQFLAIADNLAAVYKIDTSAWKTDIYIKLNHHKKYKNFDIEGIDICNEEIYIVDEKHNLPFRVQTNGEIQALYLDYSAIDKDNKLKPEQWGNAGFEGIAVDCAHNLMYLTKERKSSRLKDSRFILTVSLSGTLAVLPYDFEKERNDFSNIEYLNSGGENYIYELCQTEYKAISRYNFDKNKEKSDFADIKYLYLGDENYLYVLCRNEYKIEKINAKTFSRSSFSFKKYFVDAAGRQSLYEAKQTIYGIAEALLILENEIWIGVDNNFRSVNKNHALVKKYKLSGKSPAILRFKRPENF
ncbi:MAG: hypothetical protein CSA05_01130 [Bacteroidia bacterium]|nr:MAG: hypothetical protein CSA05_01130 [Bacteroidia bacterium]